MRKFEIGDRVIKIENGKILGGVITRICIEVVPTIFIVEFDDETVRKVTSNDIAHEPKAETEVKADPNVQEKTEQKSEITITPDEFREIAVEIVADVTKGNIAVGMALIEFSVLLSKALFSDEAEND